MLLNFFKDSATVIESLDGLGSICAKVAEEIKKTHEKGNSIQQIVGQQYQYSCG